MRTTIPFGYPARWLAVTGAMTVLLNACGGSGGSGTPPAPSGSPAVVALPSRTDPAGTDPGGLTFDPVSRRLYFVSFGTGLVAEIDADRNQVTQSVSLASGPIRAAVDVSAGTLYVCNLRDNTLGVTDAETLASLTKIAVGRAPRSVALIPDLHQAYVANYLDSTVSVVDTGLSFVRRTIQVPGLPRAIAADPGLHRVYVTSYCDDSVTTIDADTGALLGTVQVAPLPGYIHVNPDSHNVYVTCYSSSELVVLDPIAGTKRSLTVGGSPSGVQTSTSLDLVCVASEASRALWILRRADNSFVARVPVNGSPQAVAIDTAGRKVYIADYAARRIHVVDLNAQKVVAVIDLSRP